jgi:hypothetical protein
VLAAEQLRTPGASARARFGRDRGRGSAGRDARPNNWKSTPICVLHAQAHGTSRQSAGWRRCGSRSQRQSAPSPRPPAPLGLVLWWREGERRRCALFAVQIALLFGLSFYGAALGLSALAPGRFTLPLSLWLLFPAAHGGAFALVAIHRRLAPRLGARGPMAAGALLAVAVLLALLAGASPSALLRPYTLPQLERDAGTDTQAPALLDWLREQTDSEGRILHEETDRLSHRYYGSHLAALMPRETGRLLAPRRMRWWRTRCASSRKLRGCPLRLER